MLNKSIEINKSILIIGIVGGLAIILLVGLLCGLVARPNNCIKKEEAQLTTASTRTSAAATATTERPVTNQGSTSNKIANKQVKIPKILILLQK